MRSKATVDDKATTDGDCYTARRLRFPTTNPMEKDSISPGSFLRGRPGPPEALFWGYPIFGRRFQPSPPNHSPMDFLGLGDDKKKNTCALKSHKFLFETKTTAAEAADIQNKNAHLKLIFLPISREAVLPYRRPYVSNTGRTGFLARRPFISRLGCHIQRCQKGCPKKLIFFFPSKTKNNKT